MAYVTAELVRTDLGITGTSLDDVLGDCIEDAQAWIDREIGFTFEVSGTAGTTRYFDAVADVDGLRLCLDKPAASIVNVTNGDDTAVSTSDYVTWPRNEAPYWYIELLASADLEWERDSNDDPQNAIAVTANWAFSTAAPNDIRRACNVLARHFYNQRKAESMDVTAIGDSGVMAVPAAIPSVVMRIINGYRRIAI